MTQQEMINAIEYAVIVSAYSERLTGKKLEASMKKILANYGLHDAEVTYNEETDRLDVLLPPTPDEIILEVKL